MARSELKLHARNEGIPDAACRPLRIRTLPVVFNSFDGQRLIFLLFWAFFERSSVGTGEGGLDKAVEALARINADVLSGDERNEGTRIFLVPSAMFMLIAFLFPRRGAGGGIRAGVSSTRSMHSFWLLHTMSGSMLCRLSSPSTMQMSSTGMLPLLAP